MTEAGLSTRLKHDLAPDPRRVIIKLFVPGEDGVLERTRASALIERIAGLDEKEIDRLLEQTVRLFGDRHHDLDATFRHHYDLVRHRVPQSADLSPAGRLLVGAHFSHEYSVEGAALCNPSIVRHPDQSALAPGQSRVVISLRQIGEGHLSSIGFVTAVLGPENGLVVTERAGPLHTGHRAGARHRHDLLAAGLAESGRDNEVSATVLESLPGLFDDAEFEQVLGRLPADLLSRTTTHGTLEQLRRMITDDYSVSFPAEVPLGRRVLWPSAPSESNGMEDARFVEFIGDDGESVYHATYTAYDGLHIAGRMLTTSDFQQFEMAPLRGPAARNKGVALFPRTVGGRHLALCRSDGETSGLAVLDDQNRWQHVAPLHTPHSSWELIQVGNCGSPLETDRGWLVLTHGVGPMRRYVIGALLLDLHHPERIIAELPEPLLAPSDVERDGYVPNVVYSCGGLLHAGSLWLPYGISDTRIGFAVADVEALLDAMRPPGHRHW
ncbi:glycoside hydrolase family 130 protein [Streptosporangiaceae bacterium NEAU-GS5]|nr:glycoside hydrolase family 130 protein [Streptosporangiaceae bacterium NEAU-GS5]